MQRINYVLYVSPSQKKGGLGVAGYLAYKVLYSTDIFANQSVMDSGIVLVRVIFQVRVRASDAGSRPQQRFAEADITVTIVRNFPPRFASSTITLPVVNVDQTSIPNTISATDPNTRVSSRPLFVWVCVCMCMHACVRKYSCFCVCVYAFVYICRHERCKYDFSVLIHVSNIGIYVIACLSVHPYCITKTVILNVVGKLVNHIFFIPAMRIGIIDFYHSILLSVTLTFAGDHKFGAK